MAANRVLQERLLSRRIFYFEKHELTWECRETGWCECGSDLTKANYRRPTWSGDHITAEYSNASPMTTYKATHPTTENSKTYAWWRNTVVQQYTTLQLTKHRDRLPALSGLAAVVKAKTQDVYLAGIWKSDLAQGLMWRVSTGKKARPRQQQIAPSWSWANMDDIETDWFVVDHNLVTLIEHKIRLETLDPLGSASSGSLWLQCPVIELTLQTPPPEKPFMSPLLVTVVTPVKLLLPLHNSTHLRVSIKLDGPCTSVPVQTSNDPNGLSKTIVEAGQDRWDGSLCLVYLVFVGIKSDYTRTWDVRHRYGGIVLGAPRVHIGAYQRIGHWWSYSEGFETDRLKEARERLEQYVQTIEVI
jgi:hypothetical protein